MDRERYIMSTYTPMMQQYIDIKKQHDDAFLFFRLGDFYELFFEDAIQASQILEITLTARDAKSGNPIPMCGVPYHSAAGYIETLVQKGHKVAVCEQTEDPKAVKGLVRREVVRIITPGTLTEGKSIDMNTNHFIGSVHVIDDCEYGLAYLDLSTGEGKVQYVEGNERTLMAEVEALGIKEVVVDDRLHIALSESTANRNIALSVEQVAEHFDIGAAIPTNVQDACCRLLTYVKNTQKTSLDHIKPFEFIQKNTKLSIDANSMRNLELVQSIRTGTKEGTLYWLLDETVTAMGARKLKMWIHQPLADLKAIEARQNIVSDLLDAFFLRADLREALKEVYDLERLAGRISMGSANGRDLAQLRNSLQKVPAIQEALANSDEALLQQFAKKIDPCDDVRTLLERAIADTPPLTVKEGGVIQDGFDEKLDDYRYASRNGQKWLAELEQTERERTGIKNLKIGYNRVFGYFIEVTKSNIEMVDQARYERKQTLANAERYITAELKEKEEIILNAEAESLELEYTLFTQVRETLKPHIRYVQSLASVLSELDVLLAFAQVSETRNYVKPSFHEGRALDIKNGRHPVVEKMMDHSLYVPNSCTLAEEANMLLITGPNMSGKSTYMRQVALTVVMAQIGCYVPCDEALLPVTDQIFTRIGAADDVASGQSTFMMEMMESQYAITNATAHSLLLFDEIGRGTSTYDGMSLAQAMMEFIHDEIGANTLFSTHYHELTALDEQLPRLKNVHVAAMEQDGKVVFLHKVMKGAADKSYGIYVAQLAGLPEPLLERAKHLLETFENANEEVIVAEEQPEQLTFFEVEEVATQPSSVEQVQEPTAVTSMEQAVLEELTFKNVLNMTPLQTMQYLVEVQEKLRSEKR